VRLLVGTVVVMASAAAVAQPAPAASAETLFEDGLRLLDEHHPAEACTKFEQALELEPEDLGVILNLGLCNEQLDRLATALRWFRRAQVRASELGKSETETAAKEKTGALASRVPTLKIELARHSGSASVRVDGNVIDEVDLGRVEVDAGHHAVEVTGTAREEVDVVDGDQRAVKLAMPAPPAAPAPVAASKTVVVDRGPSDRRHAYMLGAAGGGLVLGAGVLGLVSRVEYNGTEHPDVQHRWQDIALYGATPMFVLGVAGLGIGTWLYLRDHHSERTVIVPAGDRESAGLTVIHAF
jgi:hypothetical protein